MDISIQFLVLVPVVLGVVQVIKQTGLPTRLVPLLSLVLGVAGTFLLAGVNSVDTIQGIIVGLSASGLWSGVKTTIAPSVS